MALGVRLIQNTASVKLREIDMADGDVLFGYTDGIVEVKDAGNDMYGLGRMEKSFSTHARKYGHAPAKIYEMMMQDVDNFR